MQTETKKQVPVERTPEAAVREFYACYSEGRPEGFDAVVSESYLDFGHQPPGKGPQGARDDYQHAVAQVGGVTHYTIDALVTQDMDVAVVWTGRMPDGSSARGLSLYRVADGLLQSTRHARLTG